MKVRFYCNAIADDIKAQRRIVGDSPAATRKVIGLCRALEAVGVATEIISMGRGQTGSLGWFAPKTTTIHGISIRYGPMLHFPVISQLLSMAWLALVAVSGLRQRRATVHLFYNRLTAYLPSLAILCLIGAKRSVDIEDGVSDTFDPGARRPESRGRFAANANPRTFAKFINNGAILANSQLMKQAYIVPTMTYYGCADARAMRSGNRSSPKADGLKVLLSGSLEAGTGVNLFCDMLIALDARIRDENIKFVVCGHGSGLATIAETLRRLVSVTVLVHGRQPFAEYVKTVARSDIGLSLKLATGPFADTTFPSKTFEYVENGLLLVTTDISDVRAVFGNDALYLQADDPQELADLLLNVARDWPESAAMAARASAALHSEYNERDVGFRLRNFLFSEAKPA